MLSGERLVHIKDYSIPEPALTMVSSCQFRLKGLRFIQGRSNICISHPHHHHHNWPASIATLCHPNWTVITWIWHVGYFIHVIYAIRSISVASSTRFGTIQHSTTPLKIIPTPLPLLQLKFLVYLGPFHLVHSTRGSLFFEK